MVKVKTRCLQVSVDAVRWPDEMLRHFVKDGTNATPDDVREYLRSLAEQGYEVLPCNAHAHDSKGYCTGEPEED